MALLGLDLLSLQTVKAKLSSDSGLRVGASAYCPESHLGRWYVLEGAKGTPEVRRHLPPAWAAVAQSGV